MCALHIADMLVQLQRVLLSSLLAHILSIAPYMTIMRDISTATLKLKGEQAVSKVRKLVYPYAYVAC